MMKKIWFPLLICLFSYVSLSRADWDRNYIGVNYLGFPTSTAEINADLALLAPRFGYIRTYNSLFGPTSPENQVVPLVNAFNLANPGTTIKVAIGVALTPGNPAASQTELDQAILNAKTYPGAVNAVVVGNENLGSFTEAQLVDYINYAKAQLSGTAVKVTTCQTWGVLFGHANLVNAADYVLANIYPYWDGPGYAGGDAAKAGADALKNWQTQFLKDYKQLTDKYGVAKIRIGETGWPSAGSQVQLAGVWTGIPSQTAALPNEQTYVEQYAAWASTAPNQIFTYLFAAIDEGWKSEPGGVGPYWGLYTSGRTPKWTLGQLPAVNPGTVLWLGTDSAFGNLAFNGGTLLIVDPQTTWGNGFSLTAGTTSTLDTGGNLFTHTGTLSGSGNLILTGAGTTIHQGDGSGFSGTYTVGAGRLNLGNTLGAVGSPCSVVVNPGGALGGTGPLVGSLSNSGTVNPGNSPGTLSVVGSYTQTAAGTSVVEVATPSAYDKIAVTGAPGTATLAGTVAPTLLGGYRPLGNTVFPGVLTATGGITGTFSTMLNQQISPTRFWQPRYSATSFDLLVQRDYTNAGLGLNSNQQAVGAMLNGLAGATSGDLNTVLDAMDSLPASANVQDAYKQISPEKAGALAGLGFAAATFQGRNLATRTTNLRFVQGGSGEGDRVNAGNLGFSYSRLDGLMLAYNGATLSNLFSAQKELKAPESRWGLFADGGAAFGSQNSSINQTGYSFSLGGFTLGADYRWRDNLLAGLATGYSNTHSSFSGSGGSVSANTIPFNAYAAYFPGSLYAYGSVGYALSLYDLKRGINFGGLARGAASSTTGNQFNLYGETGYDLKLSRLILTPSATLAYSALWVGGFTEQGAGALNLKVASQAADSLQTGIGGRLTVPLRVGSMKVVPQGYAFYQHEFSNGSRGLNASLSQGSSSFNFQTDAARRNYALVGASVTAGVRKNLCAQVNYNAEVGRGNSTTQSFNLGLRLEF
jgi:outer membrane autotransporter protein